MSAESKNNPPEADAGTFGTEAYMQHRERLVVLEEEQFTSQDVCSVVGINSKQLEHAVDPSRSILHLSTHTRSRIKGKRRLFTGEDVLKIVVLFATNAIGFPQRYASIQADFIANRAASRLIGLDLTPNLAIATYPMANGDWALVPLHAARKDEPILPLCFQLIAVDQLIDQTLAKLRAAMADEPIPEFKFEEPKADLPGPDNDFFGVWDKDEQGRNVHVGLSFEETEFFIAAMAAKLSGQAYDRHKLRALQGKHYSAKEARDCGRLTKA